MVKFEVMDEDRVCQVVTVKHGKATVECLVDNFVYHIVPADAKTEEDVRKALGRRMVKPEDTLAPKVLEFFGIKKYDEFEIAKHTHCTSYDDRRWVRFAKEDIRYSQLYQVSV